MAFWVREFCRSDKKVRLRTTPPQKPSLAFVKTLYEIREGEQMRDPICNMEVDEQNAAGQSQYQGKTYYFCSEGCKEEFDQNPQQYANQDAQGAGGAAS